MDCVGISVGTKSAVKMFWDDQLHLDMGLVLDYSTELVLICEDLIMT